MHLKAGESFLILGPGARGFILFQIANAVRALPVMITGLMRHEKVCLKLAREFRTDAAVNVKKEDLFEVLKR